MPPIYAKTPRAPLIIITGIIAKPSSPSVRLTEFDPPTIANQPIIRKPNALSGMMRSLKKGIKSSAPIVFELRLRSHKHINRVLTV